MENRRRFLFFGANRQLAVNVRGVSATRCVSYDTTEEEEKTNQFCVCFSTLINFYQNGSWTLWQSLPSTPRFYVCQSVKCLSFQWIARLKLLHNNSKTDFALCSWFEQSIFVFLSFALSLGIKCQKSIILYADECRSLKESPLNAKRAKSNSDETTFSPKSVKRFFFKSKTFRVKSRKLFHRQFDFFFVEPKIKSEEST